MRHCLLIFTTSSLLLVAAPAAAATLTVGAGKMYAKPCDAIAAAAAGDTIEVDAGTYNGDTCAWSTDNLTIRGVGGLAKIDLTGVTPVQQKGIFTIAAPNATIESFELSGASISAGAGNNGAGIRHQGLNLTVRNCFIHDNQDGILGSPPTLGQGTVLIEFSEFLNNGAGDGQSHNMYIGEYGKFTLHGSWSHKANVGHLVKTRAHESYILENRITGEDGTDSYEIDVPQGGKTYIVGNLVEQGPNTQNSAIITYKEEGPTNPILELFVVNNSIVNDLGHGTFVHVDPAVTTPVLLENNIFVGTGMVVDQMSMGMPIAIQTTNFSGDPKFVDQTNFDYHLTAGSPCIDMGTTPGMGDGYALTPTEEYVQPTATEGRKIVGVIDIGAYEYGGAVDGGAGSGGGTTGGTGGSASAGSGASTTTAAGGTGGAGNGTGGGSSGGPGQKSGCGCRVPGGEGGASGGPAALLLAVAWLARRRRRG
jgi:MYXO-CTERM domain-containing protein